VDWVKLPTDYYATLDSVSDGAEVMFLRGLCLSAQMGTDGLIPTAVLHWLTRHYRRTERFAAELVAVGAWRRVSAGYQIVSWEQFRYVPPERAHIPLKVRLAIYERDGWVCRLCGASEPLSLDHIWPWSLGGSDEPENLQTLCLPCNVRKGARVS
jgi:5-methylcytosine-specific restriction endonuclease McrA